VNVEYLKHIVKAYYILDQEALKEKNQGVKYFEYSFK